MKYDSADYQYTPEALFVDVVSGKCYINIDNHHDDAVIDWASDAMESGSVTLNVEINPTLLVDSFIDDHRHVAYEDKVVFDVTDKAKVDLLRGKFQDVIDRLAQIEFIDSVV